MASQRMLLISDKEESQVGKAYLQANKENGRLQQVILDKESGLQQ